MNLNVPFSRLIILSFLLLLIITSNKDNVSQNAANIFLNTALGNPTIAAAERQKFLMWSLRFKNIDLTEVSDTPRQGKATQALFIGEYYRLRGNLREAASWYKQVVEADLPVEWILPIGSGWYTNLDLDGNLTLYDFSDTNSWILSSTEESHEEVTFESDNNIAELSYNNNFAKRDMVAYSSFLKLQDNILPYHVVLSFRVKVSENTFLTIETVVDGERQRHLHYYQGNGTWETFNFNLSGNSLDEIKLIVSEPDDLDIAQVYTVYFDWIKLKIAEN